MNFYEIQNELRILEQFEQNNTTIDKETGEIIVKDEEIIKALRQELKNNLKTKAQAYRAIIFEKQKNIELGKEEIDRIRQYQEQEQKTIDRLKETLKSVLIEMNISKIDLDLGANISLRNYIEYNYDEEYLKQFDKYIKIERKLDKGLVKQAYKDGEIKTGVNEIKAKSLIIK